MTLLTVTTESATEPLRLQARDNYRLYGIRLAAQICAGQPPVAFRGDWTGSP